MQTGEKEETSERKYLELPHTQMVLSVCRDLSNSGTLLGGVCFLA
jgi:hypothetical protein